MTYKLINLDTGYLYTIGSHKSDAMLRREADLKAQGKNVAIFEAGSLEEELARHFAATHEDLGHDD